MSTQNSQVYFLTKSAPENNRVCPVHAHVGCFSSTWTLLRLGWLWETSRKIIIVRKGEMIEVDAASLTLAEPGETGP